MKRFFGFTLMILAGILVGSSQQLNIKCDTANDNKQCAFYKGNVMNKGAEDVGDKIKSFEVNPDYSYILLFVGGYPGNVDKVGVQQIEISKWFGKPNVIPLDCPFVENKLWADDKGDDKNWVVPFPTHASSGSISNEKIKKLVDAVNKDAKEEDKLKPLAVKLYYCGSGQVLEPRDFQMKIISQEVKVFTRKITYGKIEDLSVAIPYLDNAKGTDNKKLSLVFPRDGGLNEIFSVVCVGSWTTSIFNGKQFKNEKMTGRLGDKVSTSYLKSSSWFKSIGCGKGIMGDGNFVKYDIPIPERKADYNFYGCKEDDINPCKYEDIPLVDVVDYEILI